MRLNDTLYERFSAGERIALFFEAMGRQDYPEVDRLIGTCPKKRYQILDAAYIDGVRTIQDCGMYVLLLIEEAGGCSATFRGVMAATRETQRKENTKLRWAA